ncbi:radical SAM/SPASM domain-containing protein [Thiovibrio sp. JS02]
MKKFKKIYIEITNRCNLACRFCHQSERAKAFMPPAVFAGILAKISGHTDHLCLHVLGEPLLHPDLAEILSLCRQHGFKVNLTSNATLLAGKGDILFASDSLRQLNISLHSFTGEEKGIDLDDYLTGIFAFIKAAQAQGRPYISLRLWNKAKGIENSLGRQNEAILDRLESFFELPAPLADQLTPGHGIALAPGVYLSRNPVFTWPHAPGPDLGPTGFCHGLKDHVAILVDGTVVPCCLDAEADIPLGNILHQSLAKIVESPRAAAIRQGFCRRLVVEPLCRRCSFKEDF